MASARHHRDPLTLPVDKVLFDRPAPASSARCAWQGAGEQPGPSPRRSPAAGTPAPRFDPTPSPLQRVPAPRGGRAAGEAQSCGDCPLAGWASAKDPGSFSATSSTALPPLQAAAAAAAALVSEDLMWSVCTPLFRQLVALLQAALQGALEARLAGGGGLAPQGEAAAAPPALPLAASSSSMLAASLGPLGLFSARAEPRGGGAARGEAAQRLAERPCSDPGGVREVHFGACEAGASWRSPAASSQPCDSPPRGGCDGNPFGVIVGPARAAEGSARTPSATAPGAPPRSAGRASWADAEDTPQTEGTPQQTGLSASPSAADAPPLPLARPPEPAPRSAEAPCPLESPPAKSEEGQDTSSTLRNDSIGSDTKSRAMVCHHWRSKGWCRLEERCKFMHPASKRGVAGGGAAAGSRSRDPKNARSSSAKAQQGREAMLHALQMEPGARGADGAAEPQARAPCAGNGDGPDASSRPPLPASRPAAPPLGSRRPSAPPAGGGPAADEAAPRSLAADAARRGRAPEAGEAR